MTYQLSDNPSFCERVGGRPYRQSSRSVTLCPTFRKGRTAGVCSLGVLEGSSMMGMTLMAYEALSAEKKQTALDRARQVFLEAGADDVLLNIEHLPAWIQAND